MIRNIFYKTLNVVEKLKTDLKKFKLKTN
jgi:hypothetical protein